MRHIFSTLLTFTLALTLGTAMAQNYVIDKPPKSKSKKPELWSGSVFFGFSNATGNSESRNLSSKFDLRYVRGRWFNILNGSINNNSSNGDTTTNKYNINDEVQLSQTEKCFYYTRANYAFDEFGAYTNVTTGSAGVGWRLLQKTDAFDLEFQLGPGYRHAITAEDEATGKTSSESNLTLNSGIDFAWKISKTTEFEQGVGLTADKNNRYISTATTLETNIVGNLGTDISYTFDYNSTIPEDSNKSHVDSVTTVGLIYKF